MKSTVLLIWLLSVATSAFLFPSTRRTAHHDITNYDHSSKRRLLTVVPSVSPLKPFTTFTATTGSEKDRSSSSNNNNNNSTKSNIENNTSTNNNTDIIGNSTISDTSSFSEEEKKETEQQPVSFEQKVSKFSHLKDMMWIRETMEDLTSAEFACNLDSATQPTSATSKRAVDYDNLLSNLNKRLVDMGCSSDGENCVLGDGGMGSMAMPLDQRNDLLQRLVTTRQSLLDIMKQKDGSVKDETGLSFSLQVPSIRIKKKDGESGTRIYIRDDGTVDWEGALDDRDALKDFGISLWARINGQDPDSVSEESVEGGESHSHAKAVTVKIEETEEIRTERDKLERLQKEYGTMERDHLKLLNSAVPAGQVVANVNLARIQPGLRAQIKQSTDELETKKEEVAFQSLIYELERIYTYFAREMGTAGKGYIPLQDRLNVAEFGLLESQVNTFRMQLESGEKVDEDVLKVVMDQVDNFKRRLAIDYYVTGFTFDKEAISELTKDWAIQAKNGLVFYWKGTLLLFNDIKFASSLILRAVGGYTLKPREVRTLRRTFFDMLNFIPFVIILLIPLSPVGHVLVFQFIGKVYPNFFPSCFQESRQNLLQLYERTEYSEVTINESLGDKLIRATQAFFFFLTSPFRASLASTGDSSATSANGESDQSSQ